MGANGSGWVWMGAMGCRGMGAHKNKANRVVNGCAGHDLVPYGRGEFLGHHVFQKKQKNMYGALRMGAYGLVWMWMDAWIRREVKTRQKEGQMGEQDMFFIFQYVIKGSKKEELDNEGNGRQET